MSDESIFFERQLEKIRSKVYPVQYPDLLARTLCPPSPEPAPDGTSTIIYQTEDRKGAAKIIAPGSKGKDLPLVDVSGAEFPQKVKDCGVGFDYTIGEVRRAMLTGTDVAAKKAFAARKATEELLDDVIALGDSDHDLKGFCKHASVSAATVSGGEPDFSAASDEELLEALNEPGETISNNTKGIYGRGLTMLLPLKQYNIVSRKRMTSINETVLSFFLRTQELVREVIPWYKLRGIGSGDTDRMVVYKRDPDVLNYEVLAEFEMLPPQAQGFSFYVPCRAVTAGVILHQPKAMLYRDMTAL